MLDRWPLSGAELGLAVSNFSCSLLALNPIVGHFGRIVLGVFVFIAGNKASALYRVSTRSFRGGGLPPKQEFPGEKGPRKESFSLKICKKK